MNDGSWIFVYDDIILGGNIQVFLVLFYYVVLDNVKLEMYFIIWQVYWYYFDFSFNINNDGGMFSGQFVNVWINIEGGVLGYFQVLVLYMLEIEVNLQYFFNKRSSIVWCSFFCIGFLFFEYLFRLFVKVVVKVMDCDDCCFSC